MLQKLDKFGVKWCLSSYFSLPAKFQLIQSGIFAPTEHNIENGIPQNYAFDYGLFQDLKI